MNFAERQAEMEEKREKGDIHKRLKVGKNGQGALLEITEHNSCLFSLTSPPLPILLLIQFLFPLFGCKVLWALGLLFLAQQS